ncbi:MAG TPA: hypothetical protein VKW08_09400 [Xanthobacteraceae bacterium]|nr:hypothetical protein [Xanthobacteraceae bacterium]
MEPKLSSAQADPRHASDVVLLQPKDWADAQEALSKLAHAVSDRRRAALGLDLVAGPRITEPSPEAAGRPANANKASSSAHRPARSRRASRGFARFLLAVCLGVAATLGWQAYGSTARQMIAKAAPQLGWLVLPPPEPNLPSDPEVVPDQSSRPAAEAAAPQSASAQAGAPPSTAPEIASSSAPPEPSPDLQRLETMSHDLAVVRETVEQLAASQEQIAREIAKLQAEGQDIRRRLYALPLATTTRRPAAPQGDSAAPLPSTVPQTVPQSSAASPPPPEPLRPPMPVR